MSSYIHFTEEQKQRAAAVDLEEFLRCRGEKLLSSGREKRLASDHSVTVRGNECCGCPVPEGRMVCYNCEKDTESSLLEKAHTKTKFIKCVRGIFGSLRNK